MYTHVKAHATNTVRASHSFLAYTIFPTSSPKAAGGGGGRGRGGPRYVRQHKAGNGLRGQSCRALARKAQDEFNFARNIDTFRNHFVDIIARRAIKGANIGANINAIRRD